MPSPVAEWSVILILFFAIAKAYALTFLQVIGKPPLAIYLIYSTKASSSSLLRTHAGPGLVPWATRFYTQFSSDFLGTANCLVVCWMFSLLSLTVSIAANMLGSSHSFLLIEEWLHAKCHVGCGCKVKTDCLSVMNGRGILFANCHYSPRLWNCATIVVGVSTETPHRAIPSF